MKVWKIEKRLSCFYAGRGTHRCCTKAGAKSEGTKQVAQNIYIDVISRRGKCRHAKIRVDLGAAYTTLPFLFEFPDENDAAFTQQGKQSYLVKNDVVHMPDLWMAVFCFFSPRCPPPYLERVSGMVECASPICSEATWVNRFCEAGKLFSSHLATVAFFLTVFPAFVTSSPEAPYLMWQRLPPPLWKQL